MVRVFAMLVLMFASSVAIAEDTPTVPPPITGLMVEYRYWPEQFVQWTGNEVPYTMIEVDVDEHGGRPVYDVVLTERATRKRVHYSNAPQVAELGKQKDGEGYVTKIEFVRPDTAATGSVYTLRFLLKDSTPVEWRFVQGSDVSEAGSGLTALPEVPIPVLAYREQAAVAGEGTALQVGSAVSTADVWKEISRPPYFVAFHGAYSLGATTVILGVGNVKWSVRSAPNALAVGAEWKLNSADGRAAVMRVERLSGIHCTVAVDDGDPSVKQVVEGSYAAGVWSIDRIRLVPASAGEAHETRLQFSPALGSSALSMMDVIIGKKEKVASAALSVADKDGERSFVLMMKTPAWAKDKTLTGRMKASKSVTEVEWRLK